MNSALTSSRAWEDHYLPLNRSKYLLLQRALVEAGYDADRYGILEPECGLSQNLVTEKRKACWVDYYLHALALGFDLNTIQDLSSCDLSGDYNPSFVGARASYTTVLAGVNNDLVYTAKERGVQGNSIQIRYVDPAGNNQPLTVGFVSPNIVSVSLATGPAGAITSTAAQILAAVNANVVVNKLVTVTNATGNNGTGVVTALAATNLAGGY